MSTSGGNAFPGVYNVRDYLAVGDGVHDDTSAIQAAMDAAGAVGGRVYLPPGTYLVSSTLLWDKSAQTTLQLAPSLIGAAARGGGTPDEGTAGVVIIKASGTFPVGEFMIDYLGPAPSGGAGGITSFAIKGLRLDCESRAAGVRAFNQANAKWEDIVINDAATPSPANNAGSPTGAFSFVASPSYEAFNNSCIGCKAYAAAKDGFQCYEGAGSWFWIERCVSIDTVGISFIIGSNVVAVGCFSNSAGIGYQLWGGEMIGCSCWYQGSYAIELVGAAYGMGRVTGGQLFTDNSGPMLHVTANNAAYFTISGVAWNPGTTPSSLIADDAGSGGIVKIQDCTYQGTAPTAIQSHSGSVEVQIRNVQAINPVGHETVTVATPTTAVPYDRTYYITGGTAGTTVTTQSGSISVAASAVVPVFVPAGQVLSYTGGAPTWVVVGN